MPGSPGSSGVRTGRNSSNRSFGRRALGSEFLGRAGIRADAADQLVLPVWRDANGSTVAIGKGADMSDKSPRKTASKKSGKTLKEKRQAKKDKVQAHKPLVR